jgi:C4-dicarboxylate-specific signal transduction histidine kinase
MAEDDRDATEAAHLRSSMDEGLPPELPLHRTMGKTQWLLHELELRHVELEKQNARLRQTRDDLQRALDEKQQEFTKINREMEMRIAQKVDELHRKDQLLILQGRHAAMVEMTSNIAHQWRQPLNVLGLLIQQLPFSYDAGQFSREFLEENIMQAMQFIQQMSGTIDNFRNFFRCDKEMSEFHVYRVISQTISLVEEGFKSQRINIAVHTESDPMIHGYPQEYAQVLMNILANARNALVERNVDDPRISLRTFAEEDKSVVTVTDNAGGIAKELMHRLFDPYVTSNGQDRGKGIGLFMSKTIIEKNMGGRLTARNTGNGAEFRIEV